MKVSPSQRYFRELDSETVQLGFGQVSDDGSKLLITNTAGSALYLVDPITGEASRVDLGTSSFTAGGLVRGIFPCSTRIVCS